MDKDNTIRNKLSALTEAPPGMQANGEALWNRLEQKLENPEKRKLVWIWKAAAILIIFAGLTIFQLLNNDRQKNIGVAVKVNTDSVSTIVKEPAIVELNAQNVRTNQLIIIPQKRNIEITSKPKRIKIEYAEFEKTVQTKNTEIVELPMQPSGPTLPIVKAPVKPRLQIIHLNELNGNKEKSEFDKSMEANKSSKENKLFQLPVNLIPFLNKKERTTQPVNDN